jgi:membrane protein YdbS with pleckstrin-like domain
MITYKYKVIFKILKWISIAVLWIVSYAAGLIAVFFYKEQYDIINGKRLKVLLR